MNTPNTSEQLQLPKVDGILCEMPLSRLQSIVYGQACVLFPNRTNASAFMKFYEEMGEVIKDPTNPMEWADVFILMMDLAKMNGVTDLTGAVTTKMRINQAREWQETTTGTWQHKPKEQDE